MSADRKRTFLFPAIAAMVLVVALAVGGIARVIVAVPAMMFLPGYTITLALFAGRALDIAERLLYSLGISLVMLILCGLVLQLTPWGLHPVAWVGLLGAVVMVSAVIARKRGETLFPLALTRAYQPMHLRPWLFTGLATLTLLIATTVALTSAQSRTVANTTQVWMLPASDATTSQIRLGIDNLEPTTTGYHLVMKAGERTIQDWPSLELPAGGHWETTVMLPDDIGNTPTVAAVLYRTDTPGQIYRQVQLWQEGQK